MLIGQSPGTSRPWGRFATLATTVLLAGALAACGSSSKSTGSSSNTTSAAGSATASQTPIDFSFSYQQGTTSGLLFYVAKNEGFFSDQGLNVSLIPTSAQTGTLVAGIVSGSLDGALTALATVATTVQKGEAVRLQGSFLLTDRILVAAKGASIPAASGRDIQATLKALAGQTVGVPGVSGALALELKALLKDNSVDPNSVHFIDVEPGTASVAAFKSHSVTAAYVAPVSAQELEAAGLATQVMSAQDNGPSAYGSSLLIGSMVAEKFLSAHPDFSSRFQAAMDQALKFSQDPANLTKVVNDCVKSGVTQFSGLQTSVQAQVRDLKNTLSQSEGTQVLQFLTSAGIIKSTPALTPSDVLAPASISG